MAGKNNKALIDSIPYTTSLSVTYKDKTFFYYTTEIGQKASYFIGDINIPEQALVWVKTNFPIGSEGFETDAVLTKKGLINELSYNNPIVLEKLQKYSEIIEPLNTID